MVRRSTIIMLIICALVYSKTNVGFYSLTQTSGDSQGKWIGYAIAEITAGKLSNLSQLNIVSDDDIYDYLSSKKSNPFLKTSSINSFTGDIQQHFDLDYLVTGNYKLNPDNSVPVNIIVYNLKDSTESSPIVIQGYSSDLFTIVSYITVPVCNNLGLSLNVSQTAKVKQIDLTVDKNAISNIYKGMISMRNKDFSGAVDFFEEAYKKDPTSSKTKKYYDKALAHFYGSGVFALNLLQTDYSNSSPFRKQYMVARMISKGYNSKVISTKLSPRNGGSHFDISMDLRLTLADNVYSMVKDLIQKFSSQGNDDIDGGVYNPNASSVLDEREMFEQNVGNTMIIIKFLDDKGKLLQKGQQSFKTSFNLNYSGAVKNVFKKKAVETSFVMPSVSRDVVKNTYKIEIDVQ